MLAAATAVGAEWSASIKPYFRGAAIPTIRESFNAHILMQFPREHSMSMSRPQLSWQAQLEIIDRTMRAISGISEPEELVDAYWSGISDLVKIVNFVAVSRRHCEPPQYHITRSSRFTEHLNPWTQREQLPRLSGGILGEILYDGRPRLIENLPELLAEDDPAKYYLEGFQALVALPQYDGGEALNITMMLLPPGEEIDHAMIPSMHWQNSLFGRGTQNLVLRNQLSGVLSALDRELQVVGAIQRSLLPSELPSISGFRLAAHYETSARAGGDYYDFFPLADGRWGIFIGDVSGHGTPAAVLMAITHAIAHAQPGTHTPPAALLSYLNHQLATAYTREGTFVTAFYAVLDPERRTLTYSRAGHNPPRLARDGKVIALNGIGALPLGIQDGLTYEESTIELKSGDLLLLFTDGVVEATAPESGHLRGAQFGTQRLDEVVLATSGCDASECLDQIRGALAEFTDNASPADDQTLIAMRCC
jgi:sigma-B regulation protein RsbU (phosphoserine phosphatase)